MCGAAAATVAAAAANPAFEEYFMSQSA